MASRDGSSLLNSLSNNSSRKNVLALEASLRDKETTITTLQERCSSLSRQLQSSLQSAEKRRHHPLSPHAINVREIKYGGGSSSNRRSNSLSSSSQQQQQRIPHKRSIASQRERIGRTASIATRDVLDTLVRQQAPDPSCTMAETKDRIKEMFQNPTLHMEYLNSQRFAQDVLQLCQSVQETLENEPRVVFVQSPAYVFGDIHGNLEDLHFFSDNIWRLGMSLTAGNFLFLGDYVDRGLNCLETVAYLLAMKHELPNKVFLLRGNHETRDVNGWEEHYGERSFIWQCRNRFGDDLGYRLWESCNSVFDRLPLAAVIDQDIFCVHGGIPRSVGSDTTRIQDILTVPKVAGINPPYEHEDDTYQQVASDCIWSDPASEEQELHSVDPNTGFGESLRGGGAICFGSKAVTDFLSSQDFSYVMRAHEAHADGVAVSKGARVFTVFSTSQDHNQGSQAMAGCILVDNDKLQVINRSPAYRNQYVHRRDSVSLSTLSEKEIQTRIKLGLVTAAVQNDNDELEEEEWDDIEEDSNDDEDNGTDGAYVFDSNRRSSVDMDNMTANSHDSEWSNHSSAVFPLQESNKRSRRPLVASISEGAEDEEIATVDGSDFSDMDREVDAV